MFSGTFTALVSPFLNDQLDDASYVNGQVHRVDGGIMMV